MNDKAALSVEDPFAAALAAEDVRGRSLWADAWHRLLKNRAAVISGVIMSLVVLMVIFGPMLLPWEADFTDWDNNGLIRPSSFVATLKADLTVLWIHTMSTGSNAARK